MKQTLISIFMMLLPMVASADAVEIDGIYYNLLANTQEAEVIWNPSRRYKGDLIIPASIIYEGVYYKVTSIGAGAFGGCEQLTSVVIPYTISTIGNGAFRLHSYYPGSKISLHIPDILSWCNIKVKGRLSENDNIRLFVNGAEIQDLVIPQSVTDIGDWAFSDCRGLTSVSIPSSVVSIGEFAFEGCNITSFYISDIAAWCNMKMKNNLFNAQNLYLNGKEVKDLVIPSNVETISRSAFRGFKGLTSVNISDNVKSIGDNAFSGCTALASLCIGKSVTSIGEFAFSGCSGLVSVTIPENVKSIGANAFSGCSSLTSIEISNGVESIGKSAFQDCKKLNSVVIPNSVSTIGDAIFSYCGLSSVTIGNGVSNISNSAFLGCSSLSLVNIPNSVISIGNESFKKCSGLTTITIPNSVESIGYSAFSGCSRLASLILGNGLKKILNSAFSDCSSLTSFTIPGSATLIDGWAFSGCRNLTDIYCKPEKISESGTGEGLYTYNTAFIYSYPKYITLHVPSASIAAYRALEPWSKFKEIVVLTDEDTPVLPKCATPTISYNNSELSFSCATEGVEFISEVTVGDAKKYYDSKISLSQTYNVSVYAMKDGYEASDVATKEITISGGSSEQPSAIKGDVNEDGKVDVADHVELSKIIMASGTNPTPGPDPTPVNPSADDLETDKITASFIGGAYSSVNGRIQSGSKLNVKFSNKSSKSVTLTKMQLNDADTSIEGNNLLAEEVVVPAGQDASYTITVGLLGISKPVIIFTYKYNNKTYQVKDEWKEIEIPEINIPDFNF